MKFLNNFKLLKRNPNFRYLYIGQLVSFFGTMITGVAIPYQIYHETHSTLLIGLLSLLQLAPLLITALLGGVLADRHHRRKLLLITEILLAISVLLLAFNASLDEPKVWVIFVLAPFAAAINGLHRPALESIVQQMVAKDDFAAVGALGSFKYSIASILGPAMGGLIIAHFGLFVTYLADFSTFIISLFALLMITNIPAPNAKKDEGTWQAVLTGFRYAKSRQELMGTYLVDFTAMIFGMPTALFPAIAQSFGGANTLGFIYAAPAVGALFIAFYDGWNKVKRHGLAITIAAALWGVAIILFGLSTQLIWALFFLALSGALDGISGIYRGIMWNQTVPTEYRGRLAGIEMISYLSGPRLGDAEAGLIAAAFGVTASVVSGGILCVIGVGICYYLLPKFRAYRAS